MGRTPKPLVIWADKSLKDNPTLGTLAAQGHVVNFIDGFVETPPDLILGENCWRIVEGLEEYISMAVDAARKRRYPRKSGSNGRPIDLDESR